MFSLEKVTEDIKKRSFCLTDCGPSDDCGPDDDCSPDDCSPDTSCGPNDK